MNAGRGQLRGRREAVEAAADGGDRLVVLVGKGEAGSDRAGPIQEQVHGGGAQGFGGRRTGPLEQQRRLNDELAGGGADEPDPQHPHEPRV
ncbi:hypothetical protein ACWDUL_36655 [Nocardia niigatensis]